MIAKTAKQINICHSSISTRRISQIALIPVSPDKNKRYALSPHDTSTIGPIILPPALLPSTTSSRNAREQIMPDSSIRIGRVRIDTAPNTEPVYRTRRAFVLVFYGTRNYNNDRRHHRSTVTKKVLRNPR